MTGTSGKLRERAWHLLLRALFTGIYGLLVAGLNVWLLFRRVRGRPPTSPEPYD